MSGALATFRPPPDPRPAPATPFEHVLRGALDDLFLAYPTWATQIGYHGHDDRWPDLTDSARLARLGMLRRQRDVAAGLAETVLSADERIDRAILVESLDALIFDEEVLREPSWDALSYVYQLGSGFFALLARDYAPFEERGLAFLGRVQRLPEVIAAARENLSLGLPDRPVSLLHAETALAQLDGVAELIDAAIDEARRSGAADGRVELVHRLEEAGRAARASLDGFRHFLEEDVRPRAAGEGRLGPELFARKLRHTLASDLPPDELLARARRDFDVIRSEMVRLARELWPAWVRDEPLPAQAPDGGDDGTTVRRVLDAIAEEHRRPDELLDHCRIEMARIEAFCRDRELIGLPEEPLQITWTPLFMRAYGGAFLDSPGPLDKGQSSYFWITPPGDDWPPERTESYLREDNDRMLRLLCIHEGVPGHYLQLAWANRSPSLARAVFSSGMFAEGWAVYVTQVLMDVGYGAEDPALMLVHWKFFLRAVTNAIIDVLIHTAGMSEREAMALMVKDGFQEEQEAGAKWLRARLTSTQLSTYYMGSIGMWDLEVEARRRAASVAGSDGAPVATQRVVGGLGETPGFRYREHLESVISHGTPPIKWVREILFGERSSAAAPDAQHTVATTRPGSTFP